jgi:hypothetical protein
MPQTNTPPHSEPLAARLPPGVYYQLVHTFCDALPAPLSDSPEHLALRNEAAISHVAALEPANIAEAELAALHVIALQQVKSAVRLAEDPATPLPKVVQCRAHALGYMRQAHGALRALERMQARRQRTQANDEARDYAATISTHALSQMTEALNAPPPPPRPSRSWQQPEPTTHDPTDAAASPTEPALTRLLDQLDRAPQELAHAAITAGLAVLARQEAPSPCGSIEPRSGSIPRSGSMEEGAAPSGTPPSGDPAEDTELHHVHPYRENDCLPRSRSRDWPGPKHPQHQAVTGIFVATDVEAATVQSPAAASRTSGHWPTG